VRRDDYLDAIEVDGPTGTHVLGAPEDAWSGVFPEDVVAEADEWGSSTLSFLLRRPALLHHPDLAAGTLVRYYQGGDGTEGSAQLRWSGRIESTPDASDVEDGPQIRVECEGAQAELDDDAFVAAWLVVDQARWQDLKTASEVDRNTTDPLRTWMKHGPAPAGQVAKWGRSATMLSIPEASKLYGYQKTGVMLDARRWPSMQQLYLAWHRAVPTLAPAGTGLDLVVCGSPSPHFVASTRVEYWRAHLADLAYEGEHRIDPAGDVKPMPYVGVFLELVPPTTTGTVALPVPGAGVAQVYEAHSDAYLNTLVVTVPPGNDDGASTLLVCASAVDQQGGTPTTVQITNANAAAGSGPSSASQRLSTTYVLLRVKRSTDRQVTVKLSTASRTARWAVKVIELRGLKLGAGGDITTGAGGDYGGQNLVLPAVSGGTSAAGARWFAFATYTHQPEGTPVTPAVAVGDADGWTAQGGEAASDAAPAQLRVAAWVDLATHAAGVRPVLDVTMDAPVGPTDSTIIMVGALVPDDAQFPQVPNLDAAVTLTTEARLLLTALKLAPDTEMLSSGGVSSVPPDRLVRDALRHAPRLDQDELLIGSPGGSLEEYAIDTPLTPREVIDAARAINGWQARVTLDRHLEFRAYPAAPVVELPAGASYALEDAASDALGDTWNGSWVVGQDALGHPVLSKMGTAGAFAPVELTVDEAEVDGVGWAFEGDADGRALLGVADYVSDHAVAGQALRLQASTPSGADGEGAVVWTQRLGGAFAVGSEYLLKLQLRAADTLWTDGQHLYLRLVLYGRNMRLLSREVTVQLDVAATYRSVVVPFVAVDPRMDLYVVAGARGVTGAALDVLWLDSIQMTRVATTPLDAAGLRRTKVLQAQSAITPVLADQLNDALLIDTARPQFRGSVRVQGWELQVAADGTPVHASSMLDRVGERVRLALLPDPETGVSPRVPRLVAVSYDAAEQAATLTFDNAPHAEDRLAARPVPGEPG
jgi:hypothetical protein